MKSAKRAARHKACACCVSKTETKSPPPLRFSKTRKSRKKRSRKVTFRSMGNVEDGSDERPKPIQRIAVKSGGAGVPPAVFLPSGSSLTIRSRRLPHWEVQQGVYFITFRLADSLPKHALRKISSRRTGNSATAAPMNPHTP